MRTLLRSYVGSPGHPSGHVPEEGEAAPPRPTDRGADGICYGRLISLVAPQLSITSGKQGAEFGIPLRLRLPLQRGDFPASALSSLRVFQLQLLRSLTDFHQRSRSGALNSCTSSKSYFWRFPGKRRSAGAQGGSKSAGGSGAAP